MSKPPNVSGPGVYERQDGCAINADLFDVLPGLPDDYFHAVVCDPPYGLAFMGKSWDDFEPKEYQEWCQDWAEEVLKVLKPGGHLLAFSGSRTHHRMFSGVEDAGFEIRDTITWLHGQGFPKGNAIDKGIDERQGRTDEREIVGRKGTHRDGTTSSEQRSDKVKQAPRESTEITKPATDEAKRWEGFSTALKPATEFVVVARKPLEEDTIAEQVMATGTGGLNIDACRVATDDDTSRPTGTGEWSASDDENHNFTYSENKIKGGHNDGRYPANLALDEQAAAMLDEQSGELESGFMEAGTPYPGGNVYGEQSGETYSDTYGDEGGASRFFYTSKASKSERTADGKVDNDHPTVKPIDLMKWLVQLVTAPGQKVLDPFGGSGTVGLACEDLGEYDDGAREYTMIERNSDYFGIIKDRLEATSVTGGDGNPDTPSGVLGDWSDE